jgi:hypothetical protein
MRHVAGNVDSFVCVEFFCLILLPLTKNGHKEYVNVVFQQLNELHSPKAETVDAHTSQICGTVVTETLCCC